MNSLETSDLHILTARIKNFKIKVVSDLMSIGLILKTIRDKKIYEQQHETFDSFLGDPDVALGRSTAYKAIKIWEVFGQIKSRVLDIGTERLNLIAGPVEKDPKNMEEWIDKARALSLSDLKAEIKGEDMPEGALSPEIRAERFIDTIQPRDFVSKSKRLNDVEAMMKKVIVAYLTRKRK